MPRKCPKFRSSVGLKPNPQQHEATPDSEDAPESSESLFLKEECGTASLEYKK